MDRRTRENLRALVEIVALFADAEMTGRTRYARNESDRLARARGWLPEDSG